MPDMNPMIIGFGFLGMCCSSFAVAMMISGKITPTQSVIEAVPTESESESESESEGGGVPPAREVEGSMPTDSSYKEGQRTPGERFADRAQRL